MGEQARLVLKPLTAREILIRLERLNYCASASLAQMKALPIEQRHSLGVFTDRIEHLIQLYMLERDTRYLDFIVRHKLVGQFDQEDEAGER